jgi:very-short-patch-repair endonuclease
MLRYGLRVTTPLRTLTDLATTLGADDLERAVHEALVLGLVRREEVEGVNALRRAAHAQPTVTKSELQRAMLALIRRAGLELPQTEVRIGADTVDFLWPQQRLLVETDGYNAHGTRRRFETDRARDARLVAAGYRVLRFTWRQLTTQPEVVTARLAAALALSASAA